MRIRFRSRSRGGGGALAVVLFLVARDASATEPSAEDRAQALRLFAQGTQLLADKDPVKACPKFEEAERLAPGYGIELNLGDCYEKTERLASAWAMFQKAASTARADGKRDRQTNAAARAQALEPRLSYLTIEVPLASRVPDLTVTRDGHALGPGQWAEALPVDTGSHVVSASAPGREPWKVDVRVDAAARVVQAVPLLPVVVAATPPPHTDEVTPPPPPPPPPPSASWTRTAGFVSLGVGAAGVATGVVLVVLANGKHDDAEPHCKASNRCDADGVSLRDSAVDLANGATIGFAVGGVGLALGGLLLFLGPKAEPARTGFSLRPARSSSGFEASYVF